MPLSIVSSTASSAASSTVSSTASSTASSIASPKAVVLRPSGHLNADYGLELEQHFESSLPSYQGRELVLDLEAVESIDSAGLMTLVHAFRIAQRNNQALRLCAVPPALKIVLELSQLDRLLPIQDQAPTAAPLPVAA